MWIKLFNLHFWKPTQLYEQEPGEVLPSSRLGLYVRGIHRSPAAQELDCCRRAVSPP
jgi:hypothetical protein